MAATASVAGFTPITASPQPYISPSTTEAVMPAGSSVGWLGCSRTAIVPGRPMVLRKAVVTRQRLATAIRSWLRISLETAAAISGVMPGASAARTSLVARSERRKSRKSPTVIDATGRNASPSCVSRMSRVTSSVS